MIHQTQKVEYSEEYLAERDRQLLELERIINVDLDTKIAANTGVFPKAVWFIIPSEFCERFCFYGIKILLANYMKTGFRENEVESSVQVNIFAGLVYMCTFLGATISDSFLGKFHTILYLSSVYLIGNILLSVFSVNDLIAPFGKFPLWAYLFPALLIAIGAGGILPCVSSHGGDQFLKSQTNLLDQYFSLYYIAINIGSVLSQFLATYLISNVKCFGTNCYVLAYGIPTTIFGISLLMFGFGHNSYRIVLPQGELLPLKAIRATSLAIKKNHHANAGEKSAKGHWLRFAEEKYGIEFVEETRLLGKVAVMFFPIIFFWVLYNQADIEWAKQYEKMNPNLFGLYVLSPDNLSLVNTLVNAVFTITLIPILSFWVYPYLEKVGVRLPILTRMILGYFFLILSFIISVSLEYAVNRSYFRDEMNSLNSCVNCLNGAWQLPQWFFLSLGEAMTSPTGIQLAYTQAGPQMKATSTSLWLLTTAMANYIIIGMDSYMSTITDSPVRQWIYIGISTLFFIIFVLLSKYWFVSKEDEEASSQPSFGASYELKDCVGNYSVI